MKENSAPHTCQDEWVQRFLFALHFPNIPVLLISHDECNLHRICITDDIYLITSEFRTRSASGAVLNMKWSGLRKNEMSISCMHHDDDV